jgi:eukaryotic-like serine/threonine-protein kinase
VIAELGPGAVLAPGYRVIEHLSRTRRLDTFEVWSEERGCSCVAKALRRDRRGHSRARAALVAEGRLLMRLTHPHIVRGYELLTEPEVIVVMETLDGETVAHLIDRHPDGFDAGEVAWLGLHLASALRYLHRHGLLHLDLKPSNVIAEAGRAKLIDLSLARVPGRYRPGLGTWCYLSPEQATGGRLGPPADVWGLGAVLYEAATGAPAFEDDESWTADSGSSTTWDTRDQEAAGFPQLEGPAPSAGASGTVPADLAAAIDACLSLDPAARPSLDQVSAWLEPLAPR